MKRHVRRSVGAAEGEEPEAPRHAGRSRWPWVIGGAVVLVLAGGAVAAWFWLSGELRPTLEVVVHQAPIKAGPKVLAYAVLGDRFAPLDAKGDWYQVRVRVRGAEELGWIQASAVRLIERKRGKPESPLDARIVDLAYPDAAAGEPKPYGRRWLYLEAEVRALEADAEGTCPIHTDRFVASVGPLRYANAQLVKSVKVGKRETERLTRGDILRLPVGSTTKLNLIFTVPSELLVRQGWTLRYIPPPAGLTPQVPEATPPEATPAEATPPEVTPAPAAK